MGKSGTKGILEGLNLDALNNNTRIQEYKNIEIREYSNIGIQEEKIKRTYKLKNSTILKLGEMKLLFYPTATDLSDIVDEAIRMLYESKKQI